MAIQVALAQRLVQLLNEGRVNRPDLSIFGKKQKLFRFYGGYNVFASTATVNQTFALKVVRGDTYLLLVNLRNNKVGSDSFRVTSSVVGGDRVDIHWLLDGVDVTTQMTSGGIQISSLAGSATRSLTLKVKIRPTFTKTYLTNVDIDAESTSNSGQDDHVTLALRR